MAVMNTKFISDYHTLKKSLNLKENEEKYWLSLENRNLPIRIPFYWMNQIKHDKGSVFRLQGVPSYCELIEDSHELMDPLGDESHSPVKGLVHHYKDRALILITDQCALYCRHCFRRHHTGNKGALSFTQIDVILNYINQHSEIHEIIISGGDGLFAPVELLSYLLNSLKKLPSPPVVRLATRLPITAPYLINKTRLDLLKSYPMLWIVTQINHSNEITNDVQGAIKKIQKLGIPVLNQSVLLKGINDNIDILKELSYKLIENRIKPYYLFQCDLAKGTKHFRVPLDKALNIYNGLKNQVSHLALPRFALDLPGGTGKVNLDDQNAIYKRDDKYYYLTSITGNKGKYPRE
jgi:lysine 2,3-aminomutase